MLAFGCSAVVLKDRLLVSTYEGGIYQMGADHSKWEKVHQLESGRFFHHMIPVGESRFAMVGGANMSEGSFEEIEVFDVIDSGQ